MHQKVIKLLLNTSLGEYAVDLKISRNPGLIIITGITVNMKRVNSGKESDLRVISRDRYRPYTRGIPGFHRGSDTALPHPKKIKIP